MNALLHLTAISLKLNFRNRMAILYGYLFADLLVAFWAVFATTRAAGAACGTVPDNHHSGQRLFRPSTTIVSERERGVAPLSGAGGALGVRGVPCCRVDVA
jgi:hypothetical protein